MTARVCIVGAGPVGVVAAIACAGKGMQVALFETEREIDRSPRAATTHPSTLEMLAELGLLEEFQSVGLVARYFQFWDGTTKTLVAEFDHQVLRGETPYPYVVQTEQHKLSEIGLRRLAAMANVQLMLGTGVTGVAQDARSVRVTVAGPGGEEQHAFDYVVGCDGGRSTVRKCLDVEFEGYTWPERFWCSPPCSTSRQRSVAARAATFPTPRSGPISSRSWATISRGAGARCFPPGKTRPTRRGFLRARYSGGCGNCTGIIRWSPSRTGTSIACTSAWRNPFARAGCSSRATQRTSTIRSEASA